MVKLEEDIDNAYVLEGNTENILNEVIIFKISNWEEGDLDG